MFSFTLDKDIILIALITAVFGSAMHLAFVLRTMCQAKPSKKCILIGLVFHFIAGEFIYSPVSLLSYANQIGTRPWNKAAWRLRQNVETTSYQRCSDVVWQVSIRRSFVYYDINPLTAKNVYIRLLIIDFWKTTYFRKRTKCVTKIYAFGLSQWHSKLRAYAGKNRLF